LYSRRETDEEMVRGLFWAYDVDDNGWVSFRELMLALYTDKEGTAEEKLGIYFDMSDDGKNNALDMKEIKKMITAIKLQELFRIFEKNDDGSVSKDEFIKVLSEDPDIVK